MANVKFIMSSIFSDCLSHASISDNSEINAFKKREVVSEIVDLLAANVYKTHESHFLSLSTM